jgi:hypothetical protein
VEYRNADRRQSSNESDVAMPARVKEQPMSREVETEQEIRLELYRALIAAVDHLEGEVRLIALAAIAKAEGREESPS